VILIYLSIAWMAGIYGASLVSAPPLAWGLFCVPALAVARLWRRQKQVRLAAFCLLFFLLGGLRCLAARPRIDIDHIATYNDQGAVTLVGSVAAEPDVRDKHTNLRLRSETVAVGDAGPTEVHGTVLVRAPRYPEREYGDRLRVQGSLETPPVFSGFDYREYLARQGVYSVVQWAHVRREPGRGSVGQRVGERLYGRLLGFKRHTQRVIAQIIPEPSASLLTGILLGVEQGIPKDLWDAFKTTGTSHIVVISGFNMSIVGGLFAALSVRLAGRRYAAWFASSAIIAYTLLVGTSAAVVRAAVMSAVAVWGEHFGRPYSAPNALFATALLMTAWNPHILWDLGFLLSFAATLGLLLFSMPARRGFEALLERLLPRRWIEPLSKLLYEALVLTSCCQLTTIPIIWHYSNQISLVTLLSNALVLPLQTQVMAWGAAATVGGLLWLPLGRVLGWGAWLFLAGTIAVVERTARIPCAAVDVLVRAPQARTVLMVIWYAALGGGAWLLWRTPEKRKAAGQAVRQAVRSAFSGRRPTKLLVGTLVVIAALVWLAVGALPDGRLQVSFLDAGEGDATLIRAPGGQHVLINGGNSPAKLTSQLGRRMPFWERRLALVALMDRTTRLGGVVPVLERYKVRQLAFPAQSCRGAVCVEIRSLVEERGIPVYEPVDGLSVDLGGPVMRVLGVGEGATVLRLEYGETCFLLAASAGPEALCSLTNGGAALQCDVLQVDARAVATSEGARFVERVRPALVVLVGDGGSPAEVNDLGVPAARPGERRGVTVFSDGKQYVVR
jgi:competence protein ComEC